MNRYTVIFLFLLFYCSSCKKSDQNNPPIAVKGILDLRGSAPQIDISSGSESLNKSRGWDFQSDGIIRLDGEWEFFWKELVESDKFADKGSRAVDFIRVPGAWNGYKSLQKKIPENESIAGDGYATYRLKVLVDRSVELSLKLPIIVSAYRLYINGTLCAKAGVVGNESGASVPQYHTHVIRVPERTSSEIDIAIHVSNFHHRKGGLRNPILLGLDQDIHRKREMNLFLYSFPSGAFLIIGLYHFGLYFYRRKDRSALWFGLYSILMSVNSLLNAEYYFHHLFPEIPYEVGRKLEYITQYLSIPAIVLFVEILYPIGKWKLLSRFIKGFAYLLSMFVLIFPARIFTHSLQVMEPVILAANLYCIYILTKAIYKKKEGAIIYLLSFLIFTAICVNDILHSNQIVYTGYYLPLGMVIFIFSQTFLLSRRFTQAFFQVEELTANLEKKIIERTDQLEKSNIQITRERDETDALSKLIKSLNENLDIKLIMKKVHEYIRTNYNIHYYGLAVVDKEKERLITLETHSPEFLTREERKQIKTFSTRIKQVFGAHAFAFKSKNPFYVNRILESALTPEENFYREKVKFDTILIIPLILENEPIGFLDLYNVGDMKLTEKDITKLSILGEQLAGIIHSSNLFKVIQEKTKEINDSLKLIRHDLSVAKKIQQNMLFVNTSAADVLKILPTYIPMSEVGGDFYGVSKMNDSNYRVFLADATGHGIQAALMTMAIKGIYDTLKHYELDPHVVMEIFNREFIERYNSLNSFLTAIIVDIDTETKKLKYASAGHPSCVLLRGAEFQLLKRTGGMIGLGKKSTYESFEYEFEPRDRLYLFTDGIFEEFNHKNEEFGEERLHTILAEGLELSIEETFQKVLNHLDKFLEGKYKQDDLTILGIEYR